MSNYVKIGELAIHPLLVGGDGCAFDQARYFYSKHSDLNFESDFIDYCRNGYVAIRPQLFGIVKPHRFPVGDKPWSGKDAWHIQMCVGNLFELLTTLPCPLEWVTWCRDNQSDKMRIVKWDRFQRLARSLYMKGKQ